MKTLDEVIKAMENCYGPDAECCDKCQYTKECNAGSICLKCNLEEDALHYLNELKEARDIIATAREEAKKQIEDFKADVERKMAYNPALSWDELRMMEGKPVWVEHSGYTPNWEIVENIGAVRGSTGDFTGNFIETNKSVLHKDKQGKTWQAYRKERE